MCRYCTIDASGANYTEFIDDGNHIYIEPDAPKGGVFIHFKIYKRDIKVPIKYCPMCGKKLIDE